MVRSSIQTGFYVCDYATKPNATCGPLLDYMRDGMERLEIELRNEDDTARLRNLVAEGQLHHPTEPVALNEKEAPRKHEKRTLAPEEDIARRRLIRLWTSANRALVKGCCLQVLHLLTRREVLRSHKHWRIMLKRPIWAAQETLRRQESGTSVDCDDVLLPIDEATLQRISAASATDHKHDEHHHHDAGPQKEDIFDHDVWLAKTHASYDDWLHRGNEEPVSSMNQYVYAMYVQRKPIIAVQASNMHYCYFTAHYHCSTTHVQEILYAPRTPFLHGVTMPTAAKDPQTNSLFHSVLFMPTSCPHRKCCHRFPVHSSPYIEARPRRSDVNSLHGVTRPVGLSTSLRGASRFIAPWRAHEALQLTLSQRADVKIHASRKVSALCDTTCFRTWCLIGATTKIMMHVFLLPWLQGSLRHCYVGPWGAIATPSPQRRVRQRRAASTQKIEFTHTGLSNRRFSYTFAFGCRCIGLPFCWTCA